MDQLTIPLGYEEKTTIADGGRHLVIIELLGNARVNKSESP